MHEDSRTANQDNPIINSSILYEKNKKKMVLINYKIFYTKYVRMIYVRMGCDTSIAKNVINWCF